MEKILNSINLFFHISTDPNFEFWIEDYIESILETYNRKYKKRIYYGFYDKDDVIKYYITDITKMIK